MLIRGSVKAGNSNIAMKLDFSREVVYISHPSTGKIIGEWLVNAMSSGYELWQSKGTGNFSFDRRVLHNKCVLGHCR